MINLHTLHWSQETLKIIVLLFCRVKYNVCTNVYLELATTYVHDHNTVRSIQPMTCRL